MGHWYLRESEIHPPDSTMVLTVFREKNRPTHQRSVDHLTHDPPPARPIVSCCGSPTEKMAWIISHIIKPLNIHDHLETLRALPREDLADLSFYSADIAALYTNIGNRYRLLHRCCYRQRHG